MDHTLPRRAGAALLGLVLALLAGAAVVAPRAVAAEPVRVMALGDSITGSPGCWRALLYRDLAAAGHVVDMVGTLPAQGCGFAHDGDHEGHGGALVTNVAASGEAAAWFAAARPQVVLMHFATNDVWSGRSTEQILAAWTTLVGQMRAVDPTVVVVAAQIVPVAPPSCADCPQRTRELNDAVPLWAAEVGTPQSPVLIQDHATGWDPAVHTSDGVHPNDAGTVRMAASWLDGATRALPLAGGYRGPSSTPTPWVTPSGPTTSTPGPTTSTPGPTTSTPSATPTMPRDELGCTATYTVASAWPGGFVATVRVTNTSRFFALSTWTVRVELPDGQVAQAWSSTASSTSPVTFTPAAWNGGLGSGGSTEFGFQGTGSPTPGQVTCRPT